MELAGSLAVITGATEGIGRAIAFTLGRAGARVAICARTGQNVRATVGELCAAGVDAIGAPCDVSDPAAVDRFASFVTTQRGAAKVLVNNAGVGRFAPVAEMAPEDWRAMVDTNLTGVFHACRAAIPHLRRRGGGWIVNISSLSATNPFVEGAGYCATKAGLNVFSEALLQELRHDDIRVSYIMPGSVGTGFAGIQSPADWKLTPEDIARVVVDLTGHPQRSLPSRVEIRPSKPPRK